MKTDTNITESTHKAVDRMATDVHHVVDRVAAATSNATNSLTEKGHQLKALEERWVGNAKGYAQGNPVTTIAVAVGVTVAAGYLISRLFPRR